MFARNGNELIGQSNFENTSVLIKCSCVLSLIYRESLTSVQRALIEWFLRSIYRCIKFVNVSFLKDAFSV